MALNMTRLAALGAWSAFFFLAAAGGACAHPLGNFTINHLAEIRPLRGHLRIHYVLDIAEIPTFQIMQATGSWSPQRQRDWEGEEAVRVSNGLSIEAGRAALPMHLERVASRTRPGAGGLPILYWTGDFTVSAPLKATITVRDLVYADRRIGWKDIVLPGLSEPTNELRSYPNALIGSPRHNDVATFDLVNERIAHVRVRGDDAASWGVSSIVRSSALSDLFARGTQTPLLIFLTVLAAFGLGALHGLEPGHGKALLAFTLVGARATFKQAVILAAALTFAHTIAVLLLGALLFFAAGFATESLFTWITLLSGAAVAVIGARALSAAVRRARHAHEHHHHHQQDHGHDHHDGHEHAHAIPGSAPLHFPSAVVAAMSGGIAPCPAAIVVLLTALHLHRVGYGLFLIVVFSLGLATILTGLGLAVVHGAAWLQRRSSFARLTRVAPFITSGVISTIGAIMLAQGLADQGVGLPGLAVIAVTLCSVVAFALFPSPLTIRSTHHHPLAIKEPV
jgi:ABC-type nickel/cobalt efflux system permease component RcnA